MVIHVIQPGDTVWALSRRYNVSPQRIISDNHLSNPRNLVVGQAILILQPAEVYTIRPGDTLASIGQRFGVTVMELLQNNPFLTNAPFLRPGQPITIRFTGEKRRSIWINGYAYPYIRREVLRYALPFLTSLTLFGYGFTETGELIPIDDQELIDLALSFQTAPVLLFSSITEDGRFSSERASRLFQDVALQQRIFDQLVEVMQQKGYRGLDIDFEYIRPEDREGFVGFVQNAVNRMHAAGFFVNTDLAPKTSAAQRGLLYESHDYSAIGAVSDTVLLMTYEWGYTFGPPMAVAPLNRVREVVEYALTEISPEKILLGLPNYGYNWLLPYRRGVSEATTIGNQYAVEIAARVGAEIQFDPLAQSPWFSYWDERRRERVVWFEDVRSIKAKFDLMDEAGLLGGSYWNLMRPFAQNWGLISALYTVWKFA